MTQPRDGDLSPLEDPANVQFELIDDGPDEAGSGMTEAEAEAFLASVPARDETA